jgi:hypothetical protein
VLELANSSVCRNKTMSNSVIVFARMKGEVSQVREICKLRGEDLSDFVRRSVKKELALLGYLDPAATKALGVRCDTDSAKDPKEIARP